MDLDEMSCVDNNSSLEETADTFVITDTQKVRSYLVHDTFDHVTATFIDPAQILSQNSPISKAQNDNENEQITSTLIIDVSKDTNCIVIDASLDVLSLPDGNFYPFQEKIGDSDTKPTENILFQWGEGPGDIINENDCHVEEGVYKPEQIVNESLSATTLVTESLTEKRMFHLTK